MEEKCAKLTLSTWPFATMNSKGLVHFNQSLWVRLTHPESNPGCPFKPLLSQNRLNLDHLGAWGDKNATVVEMFGTHSGRQTANPADQNHLDTLTNGQITSVTPTINFIELCKDLTSSYNILMHS